MIDTFLSHMAKADRSGIMEKLGLVPKSTEEDRGKSSRSFAHLTLYRPSNVDRKESCVEIVQALRQFEGLTTVSLAHPRTQKRIQEMQRESYFHFLQDGAVVQRG